MARKKFVSAGVHLAQRQMHSEEMKRMKMERSENMGKLASQPGSCRLNFPCSFTLVSAHISVNVLAFMNLADKDFSVYQPREGGGELELGTCT